MIAEQSRHQKTMMAIERAKHRLRQRIDSINWEIDYLGPKVAEFLGRAQLPELPSEHIVDIEWDDALLAAKDANPPKTDKRK